MAFVPLNTNNSNLANYNNVNNAIRDLNNKKIKNSDFSTTPGEPGGAWKSFTPSWTNITVGNSTINEGYYTQIGKTVIFYVRFALGSTSAVTGSVTLSLPVAKASTLNNATPIGLVRMNDVGTAIYTGQITAAGTVTGVGASGTYATEAFLAATVPFTWATNDVLYIQGTYQVA
jgi:hypothetical protein